MSRRFFATWRCGVPLFPLAIVAAALVACGSQATTPAAPVLPDRRELPKVSVAPAPAGPPASAPVPAPPAFPRALSVGALGDGERIADLAVLAQPDRYVLAWVTYFDGGGPLRAVPSPRRGGPGKGAPPKGQAAPKPDKQDKQGATVMARALDSEGEAIGGANLISQKGDSIGGVSLAAGAEPGSAALAWVGKDAGIGQVFVTRLSRTGEKQLQRMVTRSKEGCSDVALVAHKDGFIVAYVDLRDGSAGIYLAKVGKDLNRVGNERLVTRVKGEASEVRMIVRGDELFVAWGEARQSPEAYGVFMARHAASDLAPLRDPARIVLAPQSVRGLELGAFGDGAMLGFIEEAPPAAVSAQSAPKTAVLVRVEPSLRAAEPVRLSTPAQPTSVALECDKVCRVIVAGSEKDELALYGFRFDGAVTEPAARLTSIPGVSTEDTNPVVSRDWLFFAEDNLHGAGRVIKAKLAWR
jgi:hypothetical protein